MPIAGRVLFAAVAMIGAAGLAPAHALTVTPWNETLVYTFNPNHGSPGSGKGYTPVLGVLVDTDGTIYGSTFSGGLKGGGAIYKTVGNATTVVYNFKDQDTRRTSCGYNPSAVLIKSGNTIYGTTSAGGVGAGGVLYSLTLSGGTWTCTALFRFTSTGPRKQRGYTPFGGLLLIGSTLYGTAEQGGTNSGGVLYSFDIGTSTYTILHQFSSTGAASKDGYMPAGRVISDGAGALYGMTYFGGVRNGGVIYKYTIGTSTYQALYLFPGLNGNGSKTPKGYQPTINGLVMDPSGVLYGETTLGGNTNKASTPAGVVFQFDPSTLAYTVLHTFDSSNPSNGYSPFGGLTLTPGGNGMIGAAQGGGDGGGGTIFKITKTGVLAKIIDFNGGDTPGFKPGAPLVPDGTGAYVGTTYLGGDQTGGVLYRIAPP